MVTTVAARVAWGCRSWRSLREWHFRVFRVVEHGDERPRRKQVAPDAGEGGRRPYKGILRSVGHRVAVAPVGPRGPDFGGILLMICGFIWTDLRSYSVP